MGCLWSHEPSEHYERNENYTSGKIIRPSDTHVSNSYSVKPQFITKPSTPKVKPLFGKYKCTSCGRSWTSRNSWLDKYQNCSQCKKPIYPFIQRELRPSDFKKTPDDNQDHKRTLCQMCQQLGYSCRNLK